MGGLMNRLRVLLIGAALMTGGSALASAQTISLELTAYHDRDRDRDRDRDWDRDRDRDHDRRYYHHHYRDYDRDDRRYFHDRDDRRFYYYDNDDRRFDRAHWRWDGYFWLHWDGRRWCR